MYWDRIGWRVRVRFTRLIRQPRPKDHIALLRDALPAHYSPLRNSGDGQQNIYLTSVPEVLAELLIQVIGPEASQVRAIAEQASTYKSAQDINNSDLEVWENHLGNDIEQNHAIEPTQRDALITARCGQGLFKQRVMQIEQRCRITLVDNPAHLRASHCKPWRDSSNEERLDGENGLLLTPSIDHLFDRGFISFEDSGELIIAPVADKQSLERMGVDPHAVLNVGTFTQGQKHFLDYHRNSVLLRATR